MEVLSLHNFHAVTDMDPIRWHADLHVNNRKIGRVFSNETFEGDTSRLPDYVWPEIDQLATHKIRARDLAARLRNNCSETGH